MSEIQRQIPNILTVIRIVLAIVCCYFAFEHKTQSLVLSFSFFLLASLTDYLDGFLARRWKSVSNFGKLLDPIADKILLLGVIFSFALKGVFPLLFAIVIAFREIGLTIIRLFLAPRKIVLAAEYSGKVKTVVQIVCIVLMYIILIFIHPLREEFGKMVIEYAMYLLISIVAIVTIYSGIDFIRTNSKILYKVFF